MRTLTLGRLSVDAVIERAGPTRPTWLLPDAVERHRGWLAPRIAAARCADHPRADDDLPTRARARTLSGASARVARVNIP